MDRLCGMEQILGFVLLHTEQHSTSGWRVGYAQNDISKKTGCSFRCCFSLKLGEIMI